MKDWVRSRFCCAADSAPLEFWSEESSTSIMSKYNVKNGKLAKDYVEKMT